MTLRTTMKVLAGTVAGAVLVGAPTWAFASERDHGADHPSGMTGMMDSHRSQSQMMDSMSKMMDDPAAREQMRSMMSDPMDKMSGMGRGEMTGHGTSGMGQM